MICPKCQSENVNVQVLSEVKKKRKGILYWIFIGWWVEIIMWVFLTLPWLIIKIFKPNKYKSKTTSNAVCQNCGNTWVIKNK